MDIYDYNLWLINDIRNEIWIILSGDLAWWCPNKILHGECHEVPKDTNSGDMVKQAEETIDGLCHLYGFPQDYPSFPQVLCALLGPPDLPMDSQPWKSLGFGHGKMRTTGLASIPSLLAGSCRALLRLTTPAAKREQKPPEPWNIYIYIYHYDIMCMYIYIFDYIWTYWIAFNTNHYPTIIANRERPMY